MKDLGDRMRAISDDPPPTTINVDGLIAGEQRRARNLRVVTGAACAVAAVVLSTMLIPGVRAGLVPEFNPRVGGEPSSEAPAESSAPAATPEASSASPDAKASVWRGYSLPCGETVLPLDGVTRSVTPSRTETISPTLVARKMSTQANRVLAKFIPTSSAKIRDLAHIKCPEPQFVYNSQRAQYEMALEIADDSGVGILTITVMPAFGASAECDSPDQCEVFQNPDGSNYSAETVHHGLAGLDHKVDYYRPDGTRILLRSINQAAGNSLDQEPTMPEPPLNIDQMIGLAEQSNFTLYG